MKFSSVTKYWLRMRLNSALFTSNFWAKSSTFVAVKDPSGDNFCKDSKIYFSMASTCTLSLPSENPFL